MAQKETVDYKKLYEETLLKFNQQMSELQVINKVLVQRLDLLLEATYGSKSERFSAPVQNPGQLRLELEQEVLVEQISIDKTSSTLRYITFAIRAYFERVGSINCGYMY